MKEKLTREQIREIKLERKKLRATLREKGITKRVDFEMFAREVGLSLPTSTSQGLLAAWWFKAAQLAQVLAASATIYTTLGVGAALLVGTFAIATVSEMKGNFTINITADMISQGFVLSDTVGFENPATRLYTDEIENVNAISIVDIDAEVNTAQDGSHNGSGYMAYTFYIRNEGDEACSYVYDLEINSCTQDADEATWVMVFVNDEQLIYASNSADGDAENLYGYSDMPFEEEAFDADLLYYSEDGKYGITPIEFYAEDVVTSGLFEEMQPGEVHKYTVVIWIEGDDPECTNDILGGHVGFTFQFEMVADDELDIFKGLYLDVYDFIALEE